MTKNKIKNTCSDGAPYIRVLQGSFIFGHLIGATFVVSTNLVDLLQKRHFLHVIVEKAQVLLTTLTMALKSNI